MKSWMYFRLKTLCQNICIEENHVQCLSMFLFGQRLRRNEIVSIVSMMILVINRNMFITAFHQFFSTKLLCFVAKMSPYNQVCIHSEAFTTTILSDWDSGAVIYFVGFCPIYNYNHSGINKVASYVNCGHFEKGCPTELYYSKDIYKRMLYWIWWPNFVYIIWFY